MIRPRAFTLVELVMVLVTMTVLAAVAIPRYGNSISNYRAELAARRLAADLSGAQTAARASSASRTVTLRPAQNAYGISHMTDLDFKDSAYTVVLVQAPYFAAFGAITFTDSQNDDRIVFDGYGMPDSGATIEIVSRTSRRIVTLDAASGAASVN